MKERKIFLLDTSTFIWWITDSEKLSLKAREMIQNQNHEIILSAISAWEISIKVGLGRLKEVGDPEITIPFHAKRNSFKLADFPMIAALKLHHLPLIHQDPFDRALIVHASVLEAALITPDPEIRKYDLSVVW